MNEKQRAALSEVVDRADPGPVNVFENPDDVLVLYDSDTRIISIDLDGNLSSGWVVPAEPSRTPGWDSGWTP